MEVEEEKNKTSEIFLDEDQKYALNVMLSGKNVFLTGAAGAGKSLLIQEFISKASGKTVILAPTGCAAVNVGGQTIHSFFMFAPGPMSQDTIQNIPNRKRKQLIKEVNTIVIDEISMVRSDLFAAIDYRLRDLARGKNKEKPFGGKQMIVVGDFFQLPPVVSTQIEMDWLCENLGGEYAFQTRLWEMSKFECISLKTLHRQESDSLFLKILKNIRTGKLIDKCIEKDGEMRSAIELLNMTCLNKPPMQFDPIRLCTTNREAQTINEIGKRKLTENKFLFNASVLGKFPEMNFPTDLKLELAKGARVMVLCNKRIPNEGFEYVNGDIGIVVDIQGTTTGNPAVFVKLDKGNTVKITAHTWSNTSYELDEDALSGKRMIKQKVLGSFTQLPLRLAYAITIHKSQGLSLNYVDLRLGNGCFTHGQLYTALSRCRTLSGLRLERPISSSDLILDERVIDFYKSVDKTGSIDEDLVQIDIPAGYEQKIKDYILQLKSENNEDVVHAI